MYFFWTVEGPAVIMRIPCDVLSKSKTYMVKSVPQWSRYMQNKTKGTWSVSFLAFFWGALYSAFWFEKRQNTPQQLIELMDNINKVFVWVWQEKYWATHTPK